MLGIKEKMDQSLIIIDIFEAIFQHHYFKILFNFLLKKKEDIASYVHLYSFIYDICTLTEYFLCFLLFFNLSVLNDTLPDIQLLPVDGESG